MSGDVQPRKRKDKKRKKDDLTIEEHRGTAAVFGEGDVLMHSHHDHGTGGHWCAKIIFFSLLAVLVTLIGLIILENRGLSELEANAVQSSYSGVLDGWIEDAPDDDHHDEHTLELKHHGDIEDDEDEHGSDNGHHLEFDDNDNELGDDDDEQDDEDDESEEFDEQEIDHDDDEVDHDDDDEIDHDEEGRDDNDDEDEEYDNNISREVDADDDDDTDQQEDEDDGEANEDDEDDRSEEQNARATKANQAYNEEDDEDEDDDEDDDDNISQGNELDNDKESEENAGHDDDDYISKEVDENDDDDDGDENNNQSEENDNELDENDDDENSKEEQDDEDDEEHEDDHEEEPEEEIEKIEKEVTDEEEPETTEPPVPDVSVEKEEEDSVEVLTPNEIDEVDDSDFLEADDLDEPAMERIAPPPPGKPYEEIDEAVSTEVPSNILAEEEEYEKQQEQLRQEEAQSTHMWLKLAVGGALLAATHAVVRRATAPRDAPESEVEEHDSREETPVVDRRMTLIQDEPPKLVPTPSFQPEVEEVVQKSLSSVKAAPVSKQESEEVQEDVELDEEVEEDQEVQETKDKELYSDEDEIDADEEVDEEIEEKVEAPKFVPKVAANVPKVAAKKEEESEPEEDVEIIEEEVEEEVEDEEEISDVDDSELLSRLEAKYGRLPEPDRPGQRHKDGGNSVEDDWPNEPSDAFWREQLDKAEQELRQGAFGACVARLDATELAASGRALFLKARALDAEAEARRDNRALGRAITAYLQLLKMADRLSDKRLLEVALRTIDRIQFRGTYLNAEPVYRLLIRRYPNEVTYRNNLTISFLMANRADLASEVLKETLRLWPNDRVALAHYGFVLKTEQNKLEEAVTYFQKALEGDRGPASEPRFYYHLGDALLLLGRKEEAHEVHKRGAALGHFLSPSQRSLYNVPRLKSQPWWDAHKGPFAKLARELEGSWREILKEGEAARALYEKEKEGLRERGEWSQLDLFVRGQEVAGRCRRAPVTCAIVRAEPAAHCRRGQVKFSLLSPGTHVRAHVGPTNCRLRMHLALSNTDNTYLRVDQETRQWQVGKVLMFDDSFEHEVWHNGTGARLVLIVDVWHPDLTPAERRTLPAI